MMTARLCRFLCACPAAVPWSEDMRSEQRCTAQHTAKVQIPAELATRLDQGLRSYSDVTLNDGTVRCGACGLELVCRADEGAGVVQAEHIPKPCLGQMK